MRAAAVMVLLQAPLLIVVATHGHLLLEGFLISRLAKNFLIGSRERFHAHASWSNVIVIFAVHSARGGGSF